MFKWIRDKLNLDLLYLQQSNIRDELVNLRSQVSVLRTSTNTNNLALGRILAKLEPVLAQSELDPARKADSDKLGNDIIKRLQAEQAVRDHYGYTPSTEAEQRISRTPSGIDPGGSPTDNRRW